VNILKEIGKIFDELSRFLKKICGLFDENWVHFQKKPIF
jgi:hypothetical protein